MASQTTTPPADGAGSATAGLAAVLAVAAVAAVALGVLAACAPAGQGTTPAPATDAAPPSPVDALTGPATPGADAPLSARAREWVDRTLAALTLREKAGQLVMPWVGGDYVAQDSPELDRLAEWVGTHGVGGLVLSMGLPHSYAAKLNALQRRAAVPLLIASDMENGPGMRMSGIYSLPHLLPQGGGTAFPPVMALGAAGDEALAREMGRVLAREARAVGVHLVFGPVVDVNSNPANPIINTRSMGEDPGQVGRLARAYIRGARDEGLLTTAKHFPGHGDTSTDSHIELPVITADRARMDAIELPPFRAAIDAGVDAVMTAHIAVTGVLGPDAPPATLSPFFMTEVLRGEMGFDGLLVTDAMTMGGVADEFGGGEEVLVRALEAGADILLMPADVGRAVEAVVGAVRSGRVTEARVDASVRRVLEAKARAGLHRGRLVELDAVDRVVGIRPHTERARELAERSLTLARDRDGLVPLPATARRVLVVSYAEARDPVAGRTFLRAIAAGAGAPAADAVAGVDVAEAEVPEAADEARPDAVRVDPDAAADSATAAEDRASTDGAGREGTGRAAAARRVVETVRVDERTTDAEWDALRERAEAADVVIAAARATPRDYAGTIGTSGGFAGFVEGLAAGGKPVVAVSFGSPYLLDSFPSVSSYLLAWGPADVSQQAAARGLLGEVGITGRLPISLPPFHGVGDGVRR